MALSVPEFISLLQSIPAKIGTMNHSPALEAATPEVFRSVQKNYGRQVDGDGNAWPPRKDSLPHPLLILSGQMLDASTGGLGSFVRYSRKGSELGVAIQVVPYVLIHHYGSLDGRVPRRRFFYLNKEERAAVLEKFGRESASQFRKQVL